VSDLIGGRAAWTVLGLPTEGQIGDRRRVSSYVLDAPAVDIGATVSDVRAVAINGRPTAVVNAEHVLLGAIQSTGLQLPGNTPVESIMITAPGTIRPDLRVEEAVQQVRDDSLDHIYVTTVSGMLLGLLIPDEIHV